MKSPTEDSCFRERDVTRTLDTWVNTPECNQGGNVVVYAADCRNLRLTEEASGTLQAKENGGYSLNYQNPVVYQNPKRGEYVESEIGSTLLAHLAVEPRDIVAYDARGNGDGEIVPTLTGDHERRVTDYTALVVGNGQLNQMSMSDKAGALNCMHDQQAVLLKRLWHYIVRRLTPLECCRLQVSRTGGRTVGGSDGARYKMWATWRCRARLRWRNHRWDKVVRGVAVHANGECPYWGHVPGVRTRSASCGNQIRSVGTGENPAVRRRRR
ncbi:MAG: hypothetical protein ACLUI3_03200 [Christensenellales bacterium]